MATFCFLRNVHDILPCGKTAYESRYGEPFNVPIMAFGASILYKPSRQKDIEDMPKMDAKMLEVIFLGFVQQSAGGWSGDVNVLDARDLTNSPLIEEVHTERVSANEITVMKKDNGRQKESANEVTFDDFLFPVKDEEWRQPLDGRRMTRRIIKKGELVVDADSCISKTIPDGSDDDDDNDPRMKKIIRNKNKNELPPVSGKIKPTSSDNEENKEEQAPSEGGQASDADTEASEETKFLPDKWLLTRDLLIRVHNKPRKEIFTPNEDPDDPSPCRFVG